ncbi:MAG: SEC-C metal-binding domain-containing protein, partial [Burkholderiaceae bacterium]
QVLKAADQSYEAKVAIVGREAFAGFERSIMLQTLDQNWREHLTALDALRQGIHLRGYAQKQPKQEYKREAFELFGSLLDRVRADVVRVLMNVRIQTQEEIQQAEQQIEAESERRAEQARAQHTELGLGVAEEPVDVEALTLPDEPPDQPAVQQVRRVGSKIGRNDPCPCGSGKKYKQCHGKL